MKKLAIVLAIVVVVLLGILIFARPVEGPTTTPPANTSGTVQGNPTGTPPGSNTTVFSPDGNLAISSPNFDAVMTSPVSISGQSAGGWFFEAVFPIKILDGDGTVLGQGQAHSTTDWMTTSSVPFTSTITFTKPKFATGTIVFMNDNPSGDPARSKQASFEIKFK